MSHPAMSYAGVSSKKYTPRLDADGKVNYDH
jgi:hypothetical protein